MELPYSMPFGSNDKEKWNVPRGVVDGVGGPVESEGAVLT